MVKTEVLPVPPEMIPRVWLSVRRVLARIPGYDIERAHSRLLAGVDQLWVSYHHDRDKCWPLAGAVITSISERPPSKRKCFKRKDPALMKSLTIHLAGETFLLEWLDSAMERITQYAREHGCRQLFILTRRGWHTQLKRFWSREWESMAISRDRPSKSTCARFRFRNRFGYFRPMVPVPAHRFTRHMYGFMGTFYFKEAA